MYLRRSHRYSPSQAMRSFSDFFLCSPVTFVIQTEEFPYFLCSPFFRSSHWRCSVKKGVLKSLQISRKITCVGFSFYQNCSSFILQLYKKRLQHRCFPMKLGLLDLTVFPDLNLRLTKIKPFITVSISQF